MSGNADGCDEDVIVISSSEDSESAAVENIASTGDGGLPPETCSPGEKDNQSQPRPLSESIVSNRSPTKLQSSETKNPNYIVHQKFQDSNMYGDSSTETDNEMSDEDDNAGGDDNMKQSSQQLQQSQEAAQLIALDSSAKVNQVLVASLESNDYFLKICPSLCDQGASIVAGFLLQQQQSN